MGRYAHSGRRADRQGAAPLLAPLLLLVVPLLLAAAAPAAALKFVVFPGIGNNSPALDLMGVAAQLQSRGHNVTVVSNGPAAAFLRMAAARHSSNTTAEAMRFLAYRERGGDVEEAILGTGVAAIAAHKGRMSSLKLLLTLQRLLALPCAALLDDGETMSALRELKADAVMSIGLPMTGPTGDCCGCILSHALGAALVDIYGNPVLYGPPSVPQFGSGLRPADLETWRGAVLNRAFWAAKQVVPPLVSELFGPWRAIREAHRLPAYASGAALLDVHARLLAGGRSMRRCRPEVQAILGSWLLDYPRPLQPFQVVVGPGSPRPAHPIEPADVDEFVSGAPEGVVLVAFGTTPLSRATLSAEDFRALAQGFAALAPVRVLWAIKQRGLPEGMVMEEYAKGLGPNTKIVPWVDYNDVLGHPKLRAFASHCGLHSVYEAMFHGTPVAALFPFQFEQAEHAAKLAERGMALVSPRAPALRKHEGQAFTAQHVEDVLRQVLDGPGYAAAARAASEALQVYARRRHPYERAADEVELALLTRRARQAQVAGAAGAAGEARGQRQVEL